jgi:hypothetical protein
MGCGTFIDKPVVSPPKIVYIVPPKVLTINCTFTEPPLKTVFITLTIEERLLSMFQAWSSQTKNLIECNNQISAIRNWSVDENIEPSPDQ